MNSGSVAPPTVTFVIYWSVPKSTATRFIVCPCVLCAFMENPGLIRTCFRLIAHWPLTLCTMLELESFSQKLIDRKTRPPSLRSWGLFQLQDRPHKRKISNPSPPSSTFLSFAKGGVARLVPWPALQIAVQNGWGGPDSAQKRTWTASVIVDTFEEQPMPHNAEYIEEILL